MMKGTGKYKQTELGLIPEDWEVTKLGLIANIIGGGTPSSFVNSYWNGDVNWFTPTEIGKEKYSHQSNRKISKLGFEKCSAKMLPVGTILLTTRAGIGDVSILMQEGCTNQGFQSFVVKDEIDNEYLYYLISTLKNIFLQNASGSTFLEISPNKIRAIQIPLPPTKAEQTAIATALSDADALISSLEKLIAKKRNIKQGAMQKLLNPMVNGELLIVNDELLMDNANTANSQLTTNHLQLKKGWEVKKLGEVAEIVGGGTPSSFIPSYWNGTINWFTPTEIGKCKYTFESIRKITKEGFVNCSGKMLPVGTILLTTRAGIGDLSILMSEGCTNQGFQSLIAKDGNYNEYLYYLMQTLKNVLIQNASGSTFLEISPNKIKQIEIVIPSFKEQTRIATILSDMDAEILALETKLEKCRKIKLGMMQNLLTGKIRLL